MECIFCKIPLYNKQSSPSYYDSVSFCMRCPYTYYEYDDNLYFKTTKYQLHYNGTNKVPIHIPNTLIIWRSDKIIFKQIMGEVTKSSLKEYFNGCKSNDEITEKIETFITFL